MVTPHIRRREAPRACSGAQARTRRREGASSGREGGSAALRLLTICARRARRLRYLIVAMRSNFNVSRALASPRLRAFALLLVTSAASCGGSSGPPAASQSEASKADADKAAKEKAAAEEVKKAAEAAERELPTTCTPDEKGVCLPPEAWVKRLCGGAYPDVALRMFAKGTPWTRAYLRRTMDAWNASGGSSSNDKVEVDEEVILLVHRMPDTGGMQVSGGAGGSYEALRWDGTCVSLMSEEVTTRLPPKAKSAKIPWKNLDLSTREALAADAKVGAVVADQRKECKGATFGGVSDKCVKADAKLSVVIVDYVRNGGTLPAPETRP